MNCQLKDSPTDNNSKIQRHAKQIAKENITKQFSIFNDICYPVDIDSSQTTVNQQYLRSTKNLENHPTPKPLNCTRNESIGQQSKLCDTSKAYLNSQESSLISSPIQCEKMRSSLHLPGIRSLLYISIN